MFHQACCNISSWIIYVTNKFRFGAIKYYIMLSYVIDIHSISCKMDEKFNLKWQSHQSHTKSLISELIVSQEFADVTLVCDDAKQLKAHKFMLSSSSTVFKSILKSDKEHPFIYLRGINTCDMMAILQFIYVGEATFHQDRMSNFLQVGKDLGIQELKEYHAINAPAMQWNVESSEAKYSHEKRSINYVHDINPDSKQAYLNDSYLVQYNPKQSTRSRVKNESRDLALAEKDQFPCDVCHKVYYSKVGMIQHKNSTHEGKKYGCDECSYQATRLFQLGEHKKAMHSSTTYQCSTCNWTSKWKTHMNTHLKSHQQVQEKLLSQEDNVLSQADKLLSPEDPLN